MKYYNIHTHRKNREPDVISIYSLTEQEILSREIEPELGLYYSCGIHPWYVDNTQLNIDDLSDLVKNNDRIVAIGEVGLDKITSSSYELQKEIFEKQICLSQEFNLPLIIHCVKAWDDMIELYKKYKPQEPWIIHGFRGGKQQAEQLQKIGFYLSLGPLVNKETISAIHSERLLLETDDSDQSIKNVYQNISQARRADLRQMIGVLEQNVSFLFKIP